MAMKKSILSERSQNNTRPPFEGKIRPGIKVLNKKAGANKDAVRIYNEGVAERRNFKEIEKKITEKTGISNPLYPRNVPYFTVSQNDFGMPGVAERIVELHGEQRDGDTEKHLYRFPVVFHSDDLGVVYPNSFKRYGAEPNYESRYADNGDRLCFYLPEVTPEMIADQRAKRIKRAPRREMKVRGPCDPNVCPEFLSGECKFRGTLHFYIPGVPTSAPLVMETSSEIAAEGIYSALERIVDLYHGIPRSNPRNPQQQIFYITKVQEQRTYYDDFGNKKKGLQWVPKLEAMVDIAALLQNQGTLEVRHSAPAAWLQAPKGMPDARLLPMAEQPGAPTSGEASDAVSPETQPQADAQEVQDGAVPVEDKTDDDLLSDLVTALATAGVDEALGSDYFDLKLGVDWKEGREAILRAIGIMNDFAARNTVGVGSIMSISVKVAEMEINPAEFGKYANLKFGRGYQGDAKKLAEVLQHLVELSQSGKEIAQQLIKSTVADSAQAVAA